MIDDPTQVTALMQKMEAHLPIPAQATNALVRTLRASAVKISSKQRMQIEKVLYLGDEGGIWVWSQGPRARRHRCCGFAHPSPPSEHPPARTRRTSISKRTHEEMSPRSLSPAHHRALVRAGGDSTDTLPGRRISPSVGVASLGAAPALARGRASQECAVGTAALGHGRGTEPSRERGW